MLTPDRVSQSCRSGFGVPLGVLLLLSTRLCRLPDRGVTLALKKLASGDATSSLVGLCGWLPSTRARRDTGVTTVVDLEAIFGVSGERFMALTAAALSDGMAGCRLVAGLAARSAGGILSLLLLALRKAARARVLSLSSGTFWSRGRSGTRRLEASVDGLVVFVAVSVGVLAARGRTRRLEEAGDAAAAAEVLGGALGGFCQVLGATVADRAVLAEGLLCFAAADDDAPEPDFLLVLVLLASETTDDDARRDLAAELAVGANGDEYRGVEDEVDVGVG